MTVDRRSVLEVGLVAAAAGSFSLAAAAIAAAQASSKTYLLVHGAWHGGWCWKEVAEALRGMGHRVSTPTQTGLGERKHFPPTAFGIPENHASADWVKRRLTPHPVGTYDSPMQINNPVGNGRPRTYIACTNPLYGPLEGARQWVKKQENWNWQEIATGHDAMVTAPAELARMLATIG